MTVHRPWCPLLGGGECACREIRDERTLELFEDPAQAEPEAPASEEEQS